ncbi:MAG: helix-turn-helix transcriptional regulator [Chloroflexota bacterium]
MQSGIVLAEPPDLPHHVLLLFRRETGMAPVEYLHRYRLQRARELLERTTLPVAEIAAPVGLPDPYYFSRAFKRREGVSPRGDRAARRKLQEP